MMDVGKLNASISLSTDKFEAGAKKVCDRFSSMGAAAIQFNQSMDLMRRGLALVEGGFRKIIDACEEYQMSVIKTGAVIASKSGAKSAEELAKNYKEAKMYAEGLYDSLREVSKQTMFSSRDNRKIVEQFQLQGVYLDLNTEKAKKNFAAISNALAIVTAGSLSKDIQITQETKAMLSGQARPGDKLSLFLASAVPDYKNVMKQKLAEGQEVLTEWLGKQLQGFAQAAPDIANTWEAVATTIESITRNVIRGGMEPAFKAIIGVAKDITKYLEENTYAIGQKIRLTWEGIAALLASCAEILLTFKTPLTWAAYIVDMIVKGLTLIALIFLPAMAEAWKTGLAMIGSVLVNTWELIKSIGSIGEILEAISNRSWGAAKDAFNKYLDNVKKGAIKIKVDYVDVKKEGNARTKAALLAGMDKAVALDPDYAVKMLEGKVKKPKDKPAKEEDEERAVENLRKRLAVLKHEAESMAKSTALDAYEEKLERVNEKFEKFAIENAKVLKENKALVTEMTEIQGEYLKGSVIQFITDENKKLTTELTKAADSIKLIDDLAGKSDLEKAIGAGIQKVNEQFSVMTKHLDEATKRFPALADKINAFKASLDGLRKATADEIVKKAVDSSTTRLDKSIRDQQIKINTRAKPVGMWSLDPTAREKNQSSAELDEQRQKEIADLGGVATIGEAALSKINEKYEQMRQQGFELITQKDVDAFTDRIQKMTDITTIMADTFSNLGQALAETLTQFAQTGKLNIGELVSNMLKGLQAMAAQKTASLLMEAAFSYVMAMVSYAGNRWDAGGKYEAAAIAALQGAAIMGSFVTGSGLAGMAHAGIDNVPKEGTWLLDKNERVVDAKTNADLKEYLKTQDKPAINMTVNINNSDEKGVMSALPKLRQVILETVNGDIASNGTTRRTIIEYAR